VSGRYRSPDLILAFAIAPGIDDAEIRGLFDARISAADEHRLVWSLHFAVRWYTRPRFEHSEHALQYSVCLRIRWTLRVIGTTVPTSIGKANYAVERDVVARLNIDLPTMGPLNATTNSLPSSESGANSEDVLR